MSRKLSACLGLLANDSMQYRCSWCHAQLELTLPALQFWQDGTHYMADCALWYNAQVGGLVCKWQFERARQCSFTQSSVNTAYIENTFNVNSCLINVCLLCTERVELAVAYLHNNILLPSVFCLGASSSVNA